MSYSYNHTKTKKYVKGIRKNARNQNDTNTACHTRKRSADYVDRDY